MNAAMSSRMGNSVTVINAICKREKKGKVLRTQIQQYTFVVILVPLHLQFDFGVCSIKS